MDGAKRCYYHYCNGQQVGFITPPSAETPTSTDEGGNNVIVGVTATGDAHQSTDTEMSSTGIEDNNTVLDGKQDYGDHHQHEHNEGSNKRVTVLNADKTEKTRTGERRYKQDHDVNFHGNYDYVESSGMPPWGLTDNDDEDDDNDDYDYFYDVVRREGPVPAGGRNRHVPTERHDGLKKTAGQRRGGGVEEGLDATTQLENGVATVHCGDECVKKCPYGFKICARRLSNIAKKKREEQWLPLSYRP